MSYCSARSGGSSQLGRSRCDSLLARLSGRKGLHLRIPHGALGARKMERRSVSPPIFRSRPTTIVSSFANQSSRSSPLLRLCSATAPSRRRPYRWRKLFPRTGWMPPFVWISPERPSRELGQPRGNRCRESLQPSARTVTDTSALLPLPTEARSGGSPLFLKVLDLPLSRLSSRSVGFPLLRTAQSRPIAGGTRFRGPSRLTATPGPSILWLRTSP